MVQTGGSLKGKRIVVTGGSMGIGRAVARRCLQEGARVVIGARDAQALDATLEELQFDGDVLACAGSVADYAFAGALVGTCVGEFGGIDVLVNCAGIAEPRGTSILDIEPADWHHLIDVHLHGTFNTCRHAAPQMAKAGGGAIINTSSHAFLGIYGGTGYAAGKGATNSLSAAMAIDLAASGIRVNTVCPGARTRLSTGEDYLAQIEDLHRRGALSDERKASALDPAAPEYVASLYAFLASDLAAGISGALYFGSGGYIGRFTEYGQELLMAMDHRRNTPSSIGAVGEALRGR